MAVATAETKTPRLGSGLPFIVIAIIAISMLVAVPGLCAEEAYSLTKNDFQGDAVKEAITFQKAYTEDAFKLVLSYPTLATNGSEVWIKLGVGKSGTTPDSELNDLPIKVTLIVAGSSVKEVRLYYKGSVIGSKASPEEVPTEITVEVEKGVLKCDELGVDDFGVGTGWEFSAIFVTITSADLTEWTGGYITAKVSGEVGYGWMLTAITPALKLYIWLVVLVGVVGMIVGLVYRIRL